MEGSTLADRLNLLFHAFLRPRDELGNRAPWTNTQVARAAEMLHGRAVFTAETLRLARTGTQVRGPSADVIAAIARTFEYLSGSEPEPGTASAIASFLCIDPNDPGTGADAVADQAAIGQQLRTAIDIRDSRFGRAGLLARIGGLDDDPETQAELERFVDDLEKKQSRRRRSRSHGR
ncbi:hypothetical protein [Pseudonocardia sp. TRM90224]|uniref:hypothetical protein n=1 Tax=Pseudonocardia sp. TRM90224 TaxID=2812678 RepID=UPI001E5E8E64|nr:hypothetical protein [Pseudonocardia sp. TRM90224]